MTTIQIDPLEEITTLPRKPHPHRQRLLRAAELIEEHGWCSRLFKNDDGAMCVRGAWYEAGGELVYDDDGAFGPGSWWHPVGDVYSVYSDYSATRSLELEALPDWAADWNNDLPDDEGAAQVTKALRRVADGEPWEEAVQPS